MTNRPLPVRQRTAERATRPLPYSRVDGRASGLIAVIVVCLVLMAELAVATLRSRDLVHHDQSAALFLLVLATPLWLVAVGELRRLRLGVRAAWLLVLGGGALLQVAAFSTAPSTSDDDFRYAWDAKVQLAGIDPYRYAPSSPELAQLRDQFLFTDDPCARPLVGGGCTNINRPDVHTIYPPVAQAMFVLMRLASFGGHGNHLPLQVFAALGVLAVAALLLRRDPARPWTAALWAWSPLVVVEYGNNAHIDWLAVLFVVLALNRRTWWSAGALAGAAIAVKLYPALILPSLMRRSWLAAVAAVVFVALVYVPHVLAVGGQVIGYLPGYLKEQDYTNGGRLLLLGLVLPAPVDVIVGMLIVLAVALWAWLRGPSRPEQSAVVVVGVAFLIVTPSYGWYAGILLVLVAMSRRLRWLPVALAPSVAYLVDGGTIVYAIAAAMVLAVWAQGRLAARSARP